MAKKKKSLRLAPATTRRSKKVSVTASRDELACCPLGVLSTSLVQTLASECVLGSAEYVHADATFFCDPVLVHTQDVRARRDEETSRDSGMRYYRLLFERRDLGPKQRPFRRYVGRVFEVLLRHRGQRTCTVGDVFRIFLSEIPQHLDDKHHQQPRTDGTYDVTTGDGRPTFNNRAKGLRDYELLEPTVRRPTRDENWRLTEFGFQVFDGWPDVPGLQLHQPEPDQRG